MFGVVSPASELTRGQHRRRRRARRWPGGAPSRRCARRASTGPSRWSARSATCPTTGRRSPSRCWPGRGRRRRRCWRTSDARASTGSTRCSAAAPSASMRRRGRSSSTTAPCCEGDGIVIATGARAPPAPGHRGAGPARRPVHPAHPRRLAGPARRRDGGRRAPGSSSSAPASSAPRWPPPAPASGCRVTVLEALDVPLRNVLGPMIGSHCASLHGSHGVDLRTGVARRHARAPARRRRRRRRGPGRLVVELDGGETFAADVVVVGIGVRARRRTGSPTPG